MLKSYPLNILKVQSESSKISFSLRIVPLIIHMNHFSYLLTIVQINIFEESQNIFSLPKSQTYSHLSFTAAYSLKSEKTGLLILLNCEAASLTVFTTMCPEDQQTSDNLIVKDNCFIIEIFDKEHVKIIFIPVIALSFPHFCPKLEQTLHIHQGQHS